MTIRPLTQAAFFAAVLSLSLSANVKSAAAAECEAQVNQALREMSVPQDNVKSVKVVKQGKGGMSASNYKLDAWIRLNSCSGYLMINMTRHCMVQQSYTTGDCSVSGLSNH